MWGFSQLSTAEAERQRDIYAPLTGSVRELIDATVRTQVDADTVAAAVAEIVAVTNKLRRQQCDGTLGVTVTPDKNLYPWGNLVMGPRNPTAPPLLVEHDRADGAHADVYLGAPYEGAPGHLHGGYSALLLDHILGAVASRRDPATMAATGTITYRYLRPTRLGHLHLEAAIQGVEGRKLFLTGHLGDADGSTVEAEGTFIVLPPSASGG
ncbi:MAG TPA: PaaI family thioesterase [Aeromicrobium sp.]|nr:PaaI family thioesterase [Aeromicrobium sp.]